MAKDLASDFLRQRRNLLMISIALLLYTLAAGELKRFSLFATIELGRPWVALLFAWVAFVYLWWRYWLRSKNWRREILNDWVVSLHESKSFRRLATDIQAQGPDAEYRNETPLILRSRRTRQFDYSRNPNGGLKGTPYEGCIIAAPYWSVIAIELRAVLSVLLRLTAFTDYVLPHILALCTPVVGVWFNWDFLTMKAGDIAVGIAAWFPTKAQ